MGQEEVLRYLIKVRKCGDESFIPASKIIKGLQAEGVTNGSLRRVRYNLIKLEAFRFIDARINSKKDNWRREWRVKKKYI